MVGVAFSGETALEQAATLLPDLVVTDLDMPGIGGLQLIPRLRQQFPAVRVIVTSVHDNENGHWRKAALNAGADTFLSKRRLAEGIGDEISRLFDGAE